MLVTVYEKTTGEKHRIPAAALEIPDLAAAFSRTPIQESEPAPAPARAAKATTEKESK